MLGRLSLKGLFAVVVWGASFVATRIALEALNPFALVALRTWAGTMLLAAALLARGGSLLPIRRDRPICLCLGLIVSAHLLIQAYGLQYTTAIHTGWIIGFIPVTVALGAHWLRQQTLHPLGWIGVATGTAGVLIVAMIRPPDFAHAHFGDLLQMTSCLTWTVYTLAAAGPLARSGALRVTASSMGVTACVTTVVTARTGLLHAPLTVPVLVALAFLGFICSGVAYYTWFAATREHGPARVGSLLYVEPFVTLATAALLLHEPITLNAIFGGLFVLFGVWLVARGSIKPTAVPAGD